MDNKITATVRGIAFMANVLKGQTGDIYCANCASFVKSHEYVSKALEDFIKNTPEDKLTAEIRPMLDNSRNTLSSITLPAEPLKQRKLGNCVFPETKCYIKHARKFLGAIIEDKESNTPEG